MVRKLHVFTTSGGGTVRLRQGITSEVTNFRRVFDVQGVAAFNLSWKPVKGC